MRPILIALTLSGLLQAATDAPALAEREILVLTVMQQQIEIARAEKRH